MANIDFSGLDRLTKKLRSLENPDATPLMQTWMRVIEEDNRQGVLAGTDKDGGYMLAVTYRPKGPAQSTSKRQRNGGRKNAKYGGFGGIGPLAAGLHNNLTTLEYQKLGGPPLAPRGVFSRVIANLRTSFQRGVGGTWEAVGAWFEVVSPKGVPFLKAHFEGKGNLPVRDLRGVRPEGVAKAKAAAVRWLRDLIRSRS